MPQKAEHPHHTHHTQSWWRLPHDSLPRDVQGWGSKKKLHLLASHSGMLGLTDLQYNLLQPRFNFCELISILKASLELNHFLKMFGLGATGLQVPSETKGKYVCKARGIFISG